MYLSPFSLTRSRRRTLTVIGLWLILGVGSKATSQAGEIIYVDQLATGANDGTSWEDAYADLQDALDRAATIASPTNPIEIWVAEGVYTPDRNTGDRWLSFCLISNVSLYGGFAGHEIALTQRNIAAHPTIISGDLNSDDDPTIAVTSSYCTATNAPGCDDSHCVAKVVEALSDFPPHVVNCAQEWEETCASTAQVECCQLCRPTRCENTNNLVKAVDIVDEIVIDGFEISGGEANGLGGELAPPGTIFSSCSGLTARNSNLIIRNCKFTANAGSRGTALDTIFGQATVDRTQFIDNTTYNGGQYIVSTHGAASFVDCDFLSNRGIGLSYDDSSGEIRRCRFIENTGSGLYIGPAAAPNIIDSLIMNNHGYYGGGIRNSGFPGIVNTRILGNSATFSGGGIDSFGGSLFIINSVISGNTADGAGAIWHSGGTATILNSTIVNNFAEGLGGFANDSDAVVHNSIFWGNSDSGMYGLSTLENQISESTTFLDLFYSNIEGWDGSRPGEGIIRIEPQFVDEFGPDGVAGTGDDDLHLSASSPLINAGHPSPPLVPYLDGDGHTRVLCGRVDMGAYEFGIADFDCNGTVDLIDFMTFAACMNGPGGLAVPVLCEAFDFNADNLIDLSDVAGFQDAVFTP